MAAQWCNGHGNGLTSRKHKFNSPAGCFFLGFWLSSFHCQQTITCLYYISAGCNITAGNDGNIIAGNNGNITVGTYNEYIDKCLVCDWSG